MNKQLYIIDFESSQWCGGQSHCVAWATDVDDAVDEASVHMEEEMRELFSDEYNDEDADSQIDDCAYAVNAVEPFDETHEYWEFFKDPSQSQFFPLVNDND